MTMSRSESCSIAAKVWGNIQRDEAIRRYYENPNICEYCSSIINVGDQKVATVRLKKYCNHSCAAKNNNKKFQKRHSPKCSKCLINDRRTSKSKFCQLCYDLKIHQSDFENKTKHDVFKIRKNYQSARSSIRYHAYTIFFRSEKLKECKVCGYKNHIEVCHIKSVSSFKGDTLIKDINNLDNLIGLCPNHHWEFDNGLLVI